MHEAKWLSEEALQITMKRREAKGKGENERYIQLTEGYKCQGRYLSIYTGKG